MAQPTRPSPPPTPLTSRPLISSSDTDRQSCRRSQCDATSWDAASSDPPASSLQAVSGSDRTPSRPHASSDAHTGTQGRRRERDREEGGGREGRGGNVRERGKKETREEKEREGRRVGVRKKGVEVVSLKKCTNEDRYSLIDIDKSMIYFCCVRLDISNCGLPLSLSHQ